MVYENGQSGYMSQWYINKYYYKNPTSTAE